MSADFNKERYSAGYSNELIQTYERRKASLEAAFLSPYLSPGMSILDCGCGPGTITSGLAELVAPGNCTAIDIEPGMIDRAGFHARKQQINNIEFHVASVHELPFPDESFDAAFAHTLLQHVKDPVSALKEIFRVLKRGGIIGVRDDDCRTIIVAPHAPKVEKVISLLGQYMEYCGGNPNIGREHRALLRKAGFQPTKASASCGYHGTIEETTKCAVLGEELLESNAIHTAIEQGWLREEERESLRTGLQEWGQHPDAFESIIMCEAVGWKPC